MAGGMSRMAKQELLASIRDRYRESSRKDKSKILDEFIAVTGHHHKHGIRLLARSAEGNSGTNAPKGRRIYDDAVREVVILIWESSDRICGKRLKAAMPHLVESMERHGHLDLDPEVKTRVLSASAATLDRLLKPVRATVAVRRKRRRRLSPGRNIPVGTFADWNRPPPGFLEIDLVAHCGDSRWGSFIYSLCPPTSAPAGPRPCPCWPGSKTWSWRDWKPSPDNCPFASSASTPTTTACSSTIPSPGTAPTVASSSPVPGHTARTIRPGWSRRTAR